jgi:hypothetical protein
MNTATALERATANYHRARADFDLLDGISKTRALSELESKRLQSAIVRLEMWGRHDDN